MSAGHSHDRAGTATAQHRQRQVPVVFIAAAVFVAGGIESQGHRAHESARHA